VHCFKKFCTFNVVEGTNDGMLWNDSEDGGIPIFLTLTSNIRSECEKDDGIYCEDGVSDTD